KNQTREISFKPCIAMNDYIGLAAALADGAGIGELPPIVQPSLIKKGLLVAVMPSWKFEAVEISLVHLGNRHIPRQVKLFKDYALEAVPNLFPERAR
ncbi:MAG: LysR substrate-binding domain-containing protein, partial [Pseudomonadales bacterium]